MSSFDISGRQFAYLARGNGPVALFVHGFPLDARLWLDQVEGLADLRTVVAVDLRGHGGSDPVGGEALTMEQHADDVASITAAIGVDQVDLVGLSMGGYVALAFAQRHPALLRSLALVDSKALGDTDAGRAARDAMAEQVIVDGRVALADAMVAALLSPAASLIARARLRTMIEATAYETILGALAGMKVREDRTGVLRTIAVPTAVVVGEDDRLTTPEDAHTMATAINGATLHVIPGAGHLPPLETPDALDAILRELWARADPH